MLCHWVSSSRCFRTNIMPSSSRDLVILEDGGTTFIQITWSHSHSDTAPNWEQMLQKPPSQDNKGQKYITIGRWNRKQMNRQCYCFLHNLGLQQSRHYRNTIYSMTGWEVATGTEVSITEPPQPLQNMTTTNSKEAEGTTQGMHALHHMSSDDNPTGNIITLQRSLPNVQV